MDVESQCIHQSQPTAKSQMDSHVPKSQLFTEGTKLFSIANVFLQWHQNNSVSVLLFANYNDSVQRYICATIITITK